MFFSRRNIIPKFLRCYNKEFTETHYDVLGVSQYATKVEIVAKYRSLIRVHHPDKHSGSENEEKHTEIFKKCKEAHEVLTNDGSRGDYDKKIGVIRRYKSKFLQMTEKSKKPKIKLYEEEEI
jgi:curved DNA-binding protein CbpA